MSKADNPGSDDEASTSKEKSQAKSSKVSTSNPPPLDEVDKWSFDALLLADTTENKPLFFLGQSLFMRYGFINTFHIPPSTVTAFLTRIENGYISSIAFHNSGHAADVTHSMHYFLHTSGLKKYLSDLETFASVYAAMIHDYNHNGRTNKFLVMTGSDRALLYNDKSVQENHHLSASFFILKTPECNMVQNLTHSEYREFRNMVIDMVLSTDMAFHYQLVREMKARMNDPSPITDRKKVMSFTLHAADIAFNAKIWSTQIKWVDRIFDEFFKQGDAEKELGLPVSPQCDRETVSIPEAQIHWNSFVVEPLMNKCTELIERVLYEQNLDAENLDAVLVHIDKPWIDCIRENKKKWKIRYAQEKGIEPRSSKSR